MRLFTCDNCLYTFPRRSMPESCPDCGKSLLRDRRPAVRPATEAEALWFRRVQAELALEDQRACRPA